MRNSFNMLLIALALFDTCYNAASLMETVRKCFGAASRLERIGINNSNSSNFHTQ